VTQPSVTQPRVGLFVTCLVDFFRPPVGFASVELLERAGCSVEVPRTQTCCGQPAWNGGDRKAARRLGRAFLEAFEGFDYVVAPSGSCIGMVRQLPDVLGDDPGLAGRARSLAARSYEITAFLVDVLGERGEPVALRERVTYHDACAGLRELGVKAQPRALLEGAGVMLHEMPNAEICCGFGGTFCLKYPEISKGMVDEKLDAIDASEASLVLAGDLGCLLNVAGRLTRTGRAVRARHVVEVLAGELETPPLGGEGTP